MFSVPRSTRRTKASGDRHANSGVNSTSSTSAMPDASSSAARSCGVVRRGGAYGVSTSSGCGLKVMATGSVPIAAARSQVRDNSA